MMTKIEVDFGQNKQDLNKKKLKIKRGYKSPRRSEGADRRSDRRSVGVGGAGGCRQWGWGENPAVGGARGCRMRRTWCVGGSRGSRRSRTGGCAVG